MNLDQIFKAIATNLQPQITITLNVDTLQRAAEALSNNLRDIHHINLDAPACAEIVKKVLGAVTGKEL